MKERPILFSSPMIRALLDGRKSQTRRLVKPGPSQKWLTPRIFGEVRRWAQDGTHPDWWKMAVGQPTTLIHCGHEMDGGHIGSIRCPHGAPGDRLWVREAWNLGRALRNCEGTIDDEMDWPGPIPKDDPRGKRLLDDWCLGYAADGGEGKWRPSIHMPRWASRLTLEITAVRVERLQDISHEDVLAEGVAPEDILASEGARAEGTIRDLYRRGFASLWSSIHGPGSWEANPWAWVVEFKRLSTP
jgi:hypothetical protein